MKRCAFPLCETTEETSVHRFRDVVRSKGDGLPNEICDGSHTQNIGCHRFVPIPCSFCREYAAEGVLGIRATVRGYMADPVKLPICVHCSADGLLFATHSQYERW